MKQTPLKRNTPLKSYSGLKQSRLQKKFIPKDDLYKTFQDAPDSLSGLQKMELLDRIFSETMRRTWTNDSGLCQCITCEEWKYWRAGDCGHYPECPRGNLATRYDTRNVGFQCSTCNRYNEGETEKFEQYLIATYGPEMPGILKSKAREIIYDMPWDDLITDWSRKLAALVEVQENSIAY